MRELFYDMVDLSNQIGRPATCVYWILVRTVPPPVSCESYGVCITMLQTGEREEVLDITVRPANPVLGTDAGARGRNPLHFTGGDRRLAVNYPPQGDGVQGNPSGVHWSKPIL